MSTQGTFPSTDTGLLAWSQNFSTLLSAQPTVYGCTLAQAASYAALNSSFTTAMAAVDPGVRSKSAVAAKNTARAALKTNAKQLAAVVMAQPGVSNAQKIALGLKPRAVPTPTPVPADAPGLDVVSVSGFGARIKLHDSAIGSRRGRPAGVSGASVFSHIGPTAPADLGTWHFEGNTGLTVVDIVFPNTTPAGTTVWFCAFWFNGSKKPGPTCPPLSTNLPGGAVSMAA